MNIVCDKTLLSAAIDGVSKAVTMRSSIPVLEGILLKAEGFQLTLTGYDLEMGIVTTIEANIKEPGEIVLNAKLLSSMISRMPAGQISIVAADNGKTTIQSGVAQFEIQSMPATDFPDLPNTGAEQTLTIKTGVLRDMIDRTLYAVSQDEKKPAHTGELFEIELDKLTIVALDGYRLAIVERPITAVKDIRIIVPSKTLQNRAKIFSPFSPLRGYDEQLAAEKQRTERVTKRILTEEEMSALSDRLMQVTKGMTITVRYFKEDTAHPEIPAVGNYITLTGKADRIDPVFRTLQVGDTVVPFEDLVEVSGEGIMDIDVYLGIGEE